MGELIAASLRFPTVVFTIALGIALVYWLFVLLGALDIDLFGHDVGDAGGHDLGGHDAGGDGHDVDADADGLWHFFGFGTVPLTISISFIILVCWCGSLLGATYVVGDSLPLRALLVPIVLLLSLPVAALLCKPLAPVFEIKEGKSNADYVGHFCTITTDSVDTTFGFANIVDGSSLVQISVRCDRAGALAAGDKALIIEFDAARRTFLVEPAKDLVATTKETPDG